MKVSKILVPAVALMATNNYVNPNVQVQALTCEDIAQAANACLEDWNVIRAGLCYTSAMALYATCIAIRSGVI